MRRLARPEAADEIADELVRLAEEGREPSNASKGLLRSRGGGTRRDRRSRAARGAPLLLRRHRRRRALRLRELRPRVGGRGAGLGRARDDLHGDARRASSVDVGGDPAPPAGFEVVVSTAHVGRARGTVAGGLPRRARRASPLDRRRRRAREDDDRGDDRVRPPRARRTTRRGSSAASSRSSAATRARGRAGSWSRGTSPTARSRSSGPRSPSSRTSSSTTTRRSRPRPSSPRSSTTWLDGRTRRRPRLGARAGGLRALGAREHNRLNAAAALAALELAGVARADAEAALAALRGRRAALRARRRAWRRAGLRRLRAQPDRDRRDAAHGARADRRVGSSPSTSRTSTSGRASSHASSAPRSGLADAAVVTDVIGGRDAPRPGRHGEARARQRPGWRAAGLGADARRCGGARALLGSPGDVVVTLGVGEPWRIARAIVEGLAP